MKGVKNYSSEFFLIIIFKGFLEVNIIFFNLKKKNKSLQELSFGCYMKYWQFIQENIQDAYSLILIILITDITYIDFYPVTYFWIHLICLQVFVALVSASDIPVSPLCYCRQAGKSMHSQNNGSNNLKCQISKLSLAKL